MRAMAQLHRIEDQLIRHGDGSVDEQPVEVPTRTLARLLAAARTERTLFRLHRARYHRTLRLLRREVDRHG